MMKNGVSFIVITLSTLCCQVIQDFDVNMQINNYQKACEVTMWTQNDVKSQKMEYLQRQF